MDNIVGINVSKNRLDVHLMPSSSSFCVDNSHTGIVALVSRLANIPVEAIALEATGGYEKLAVAELTATGFAVLVVNPAQVRAYANSLG